MQGGNSVWTGICSVLVCTDSVPDHCASLSGPAPGYLLCECARSCMCLGVIVHACFAVQEQMRLAGGGGGQPDLERSWVEAPRWITVQSLGSASGRHLNIVMD